MAARQHRHRTAPCAGGRALAILADVLDVRILTALRLEPTGLAELRVTLGAPAPTTLRSHLRDLEELGLLRRMRADGFPGRARIELLDPGRRLLQVAERFSTWLASGPSGAIALGTPTSGAVLSALAYGWSSLVLRALAAAPLSLVQLDRLIGSLDYPTLSRRIDALRVTGLIHAREATDRAIPFAPAAWLADAIVPLLAAVRWERESDLAPVAQIRVADVEAALLLGAPRLRAADHHSGRCRLLVGLDGGRVGGGVARFDRGRVNAVEADPHGFATAAISGGSSAWMAAVLDGESARLKVSGNRSFAGSVVESLGRRSRR